MNPTRVITVRKYFFEPFDKAKNKFGEKSCSWIKPTCKVTLDYCGVEPNAHERFSFAHFDGCKCRIPKVPDHPDISSGPDDLSWWVEHHVK